MIFCYIGAIGHETSPIMFDDMEEFTNKTFNPVYYWDNLIDTETPPPGKTYQDKKEWLRGRAIAYSHASDNYILYDFWHEQELMDYFRIYGRKYGLLREFKENAIC